MGTQGPVPPGPFPYFRVFLRPTWGRQEPGRGESGLAAPGKHGVSRSLCRSYSLQAPTCDHSQRAACSCGTPAGCGAGSLKGRKAQNWPREKGGPARGLRESLRQARGTQASRFPSARGAVPVLAEGGTGWALIGQMSRLDPGRACPGWGHSAGAQAAGHARPTRGAQS